MFYWNYIITAFQKDIHTEIQFVSVLGYPAITCNGILRALWDLVPLVVGFVAMVTTVVRENEMKAS